MGILFFASFMVSVASTLIFKKIALGFNIVSTSKAPRFETRCVPYLGGVAVFFSILLVMLVLKFCCFRDARIVCLTIVGFVVLMFGLIDDVVELTPFKKFFFQSVAVIIWIGCGFKTEIIFFPVWLNCLVTYVWIIGIINAINFLDILDGLAGAISFIIACVFMYISFKNNDTFLLVFNVILSSAILGFLIFNKPKAKIFLGDAGSQFLGFILAAESILFQYAPSGSDYVRVFIPIVILGVPVLDMFFVIINRILDKKPIFIGSNHHFSLILVSKGFSTWLVLIIMCVFEIIFAGLALLIFNFYK